MTASDSVKLTDYRTLHTERIQQEDLGCLLVVAVVTLANL